jgi:hypothetical protein
MPRGEARRLLVREGKALMDRIDEVCKGEEEEGGSSDESEE